MNTEELAFWVALEREPKDETTKLVLADWLQDNDKPELSHAVRWCVGWNRGPRYWEKGVLTVRGSLVYPWYWRSGAKEFKQKPTKTMTNSIPAALFGFVRKVSGKVPNAYSHQVWREARKSQKTSLWESLEVLAGALTDVLNLYSLPKRGI